MKTLLVAVIVAILFLPALAPAYKQVRDGSGNLLKPGQRRVTYRSPRQGQ